MQIEIERVEDLERHLDTAGDLRGVVVQGLDLRDMAERLCCVSSEGAVYLGCRLGVDVERNVLASGGVVFPEPPETRPYRPYRPALYTPSELMDGYRRGTPTSWTETLDQRIYRHFDGHRRSGGVPILEALAQRLHDHAIDNALDGFLATGAVDADGRPVRHPVVAVMGGHSMARDEPGYRQVAELALGLSEALPGTVLATGGGPGAMEACHLGAWLASAEAGERELGDALEVLARAPTYRHSDWFETALEVRDRYPAAVVYRSLGVPTWFYGHEPANLFASHHAKYFSNSLREDGLLALASHGVVYAPGSAGTVQEAFMDAAQNHYGTFRLVSPMVFLGVDYWTERLPARQLVERLSAGRQYADLLAFVETVEEAVDFLARTPPVLYEG